MKDASFSTEVMFFKVEDQHIIQYKNYFVNPIPLFLIKNNSDMKFKM